MCLRNLSLTSSIYNKMEELYCDFFVYAYEVRLPSSVNPSGCLSASLVDLNESVLSLQPHRAVDCIEASRQKGENLINN